MYYLFYCVLTLIRNEKTKGKMMSKYFMLVSLILSLLSIILLTTNEWMLGVVGLVISFVLALKSKNKIIIFVVSVIFFCGVIILLFLIVMGLLMGGLVDMEDGRLP
ncbi:hypothetical protein AZF06_22850 [Priestia endophytica]|nr:hypothetical protein AZF06_22850 [Priestia endophytica]